MKKSDLMVGYVVVLRGGAIGMVMAANDRVVIPVVNTDGTKQYCTLGSYLEDLTCMPNADCDIMSVYGFSRFYLRVADISTDGRELLWKREETKKMTVAEVCKALGYDVEIVKDGDSK